MKHAGARALLAVSLVIARESHAQSKWPAPRDGHSMVGADDGILMFGGSNGAVFSIDTLWLWDGRVWTVASTIGPVARSLAAVAFDSRRRVLVLHGGAESGLGSRFADTWEWNSQGWRKIPVHSPGPRDHHAMAYDEARGHVVMYGGFDYVRGTDLLKETWTWDGRAWKVADSITGPGPMAHHAMAYDKRRQRIVMVGNVKEPPAGPGRLSAASEWRWSTSPQTWEWDGARWQRAEAAPPDVRAPHRLAYDEVQGVTMLLGGQDSVRATWSWDGSSWKLHAEANSPNIGNAAAIAYDMQRRKVVAWGGSTPYRRDRPRTQQAAPSEWPSSVWEWTGSRWEEHRSR
jgi:hypothetical protein